MPDMTAARSRHYEVIARAIAFIRGHARSQPTLEEIAAAVHLSPYHLQRLFAGWAGISPKRFLQYLTKEYAKKQLAGSCPTGNWHDRPGRRRHNGPWAVRLPRTRSPS